jgi:exo-1,4-beta-D-glucosaminidase
MKSSARLAGVILAFLSCGILSSAVSADPAGAGAKIYLHSGWQLASSCDVHSAGDTISTVAFHPTGWHATTVPSTVVGALVADGTFPDPYFGENLRSIPGTSYPIGKMFSVLPMPDGSPFRCSWWYRTEFPTPEKSSDGRVWLNFGGINNRANIWLNGKKIAGSAEVAGAYRTYEFDVTALAARDGSNVLAVEVFAQTENDLGINWVDWNPTPPDKNMGLWRDVYLRVTGPVKITYPQVVTHFPQDSRDLAELTVRADLENASPLPRSGVLIAELEGQTLRQPVDLAPGQKRTVRLAPAAFPALRIHHPELWWPRQMGDPALHSLSLRFSIGARESDAAAIRYGIREVTSEIDASGHRLFRVNGQKILIRGAGWAPDMLLRQSSERLAWEFRYVRDMNLNAIRLEGKLETDEFYDLADQQGVLILAGWCCCDHWEQWSKWGPGDLPVATASLRSQILRMRSHPSMLAWLNGSDNPPPANVERAYIDVLKKSDWPNPYLSSASGKATAVSGATGVKMSGPYDYVPPDYWLTDKKDFGGAFGFNTESSPGPAVPLLSCLKKMLPAANLVPDDPVWNYHAGSEGFQNLNHFDEAMKAVYGDPPELADYERKSQAMAYDGERAMFEAYSRNKYVSTGVVQWMLNNAWPSLIWHLYDYYLQPAGGYFGAKKACEPLHVQYSYDDRSVAVVNSTYRNAPGLTVRAAVFDAGLHGRFSAQAPANVAADGVTRVLTLPDEAFQSGAPLYFVRLSLENATGEVLSTNFYWLSAKRNVFNWTKTDYHYTPVSSREDLTALESLPSAGKLSASAKIEKAGERSGDNPNDGPLVRVKLQNPSDHLAFQVRLGIRRQNEEMEILPVLWQDNYFELIPGESREITAQFLVPDALRGSAEVDVTGWNIEPVSLPLANTGGTSESQAH